MKKLTSYPDEVIEALEKFADGLTMAQCYGIFTYFTHYASIESVFVLSLTLDELDEIMDVLKEALGPEPTPVDGSAMCNDPINPSVWQLSHRKISLEEYKLAVPCEEKRARDMILCLERYHICHTLGQKILAVRMGYKDDDE